MKRINKQLSICVALVGMLLQSTFTFTGGGCSKPSAATVAPARVPAAAAPAGLAPVPAKKVIGVVVQGKIRRLLYRRYFHDEHGNVKFDDVLGQPEKEESSSESGTFELPRPASLSSVGDEAPAPAKKEASITTINVPGGTTITISSVPAPRPAPAAAAMILHAVSAAAPAGMLAAVAEGAETDDAPRTASHTQDDRKRA